MLKNLPNDQTNDTKYVKTLFETHFQNANFKKLHHEGRDKHGILAGIVSTKEYFIMKGNLFCIMVR